MLIVSPHLFVFGILVQTHQHTNRLEDTINTHYWDPCSDTSAYKQVRGYNQHTLLGSLFRHTSIQTGEGIQSTHITGTLVQTHQHTNRLEDTINTHYWDPCSDTPAYKQVRGYNQHTLLGSLFRHISIQTG